MDIGRLLQHMMARRGVSLSREDYARKRKRILERDLEVLRASEFYHDMLYQTGPLTPPSPYDLVTARQYGTQRRAKKSASLNRHSPEGFTSCERNQLLGHRLPTHYDSELSKHLSERNESSLFSAQFSTDGTRLCVAQQNGLISVIDTETWKPVKHIVARDIGWAILDTAYSPDMNFIIYSSWCPQVHIVNIQDGRSIHQSLNFSDSHGHVAFFSVKFSQDSKEIIAGSNDQHLYLYDIPSQTRTHRILGHNDDINAVCFADESSNVFFSGSDDHVVRVWDRRSLGTGQQSAGALLGHTHGITFIDSKGDGRYLLSNGKDQTARLWDIRKMSSNVDDDYTSDAHMSQDYRYFSNGFTPATFKKSKQDASLMTYRGHIVKQTLIRARFSPVHSTGQRYIYTAGGDGAAIIYDALTGKILSENQAHSGGEAWGQAVRDVSWHPYKPLLVAASFRGYLDVYTPEPNGRSRQDAEAKRFAQQHDPHGAENDYDTYLDLINAVVADDADVDMLGQEDSDDDVLWASHHEGSEDDGESDEESGDAEIDQVDY